MRTQRPSNQYRWGNTHLILKCKGSVNSMGDLCYKLKFKLITLQAERFITKKYTVSHLYLTVRIAVIKLILRIGVLL